jgi:hypothetical protein
LICTRKSEEWKKIAKSHGNLKSPCKMKRYMADVWHVTAWTKKLLERLAFLQIFNKWPPFPPFYKTRTFLTVFARLRR